MRIQHPGDDHGFRDEVVEAMLRGLAESGAAICLCDEADRIRYMNAPFRAAFCPDFDGRPAEFIDVIAEAIASGIGIKLESTTLDDFVLSVRQGRRDLRGSRSFATDMAQGGWWSVTDTKLSNGWLLAVAQDITGLKHEEARLRAEHSSALVEARTDDLTGAPNRRYGLRRAEALWKQARAGDTPLALALLDIDHFKSINDVYGHEVGDRALVHFVNHVLSSIGARDQFSRLGGDEFLLVRAGATASELYAALAAVLGSLPRLTTDGASERMRLSISVGVAEPRPGDTWPGLMHRADMALYDAKARGRDRIAIAV